MELGIQRKNLEIHLKQTKSTIAYSPILSMVSQLVNHFHNTDLYKKKLQKIQIAMSRTWGRRKFVNFAGEMLNGQKTQARRQLATSNTPPNYFFGVRPTLLLIYPKIISTNFTNSHIHYSHKFTAPTYTNEP